MRVAATTLLGWANSPFSYIEARNPQAVVEIGDRPRINNAAVLIAEGAGIKIGARRLICTEWQVMDTNAHELKLGRRAEVDSQTRQVVMGDDVFIGLRVTLLNYAGALPLWWLKTSSHSGGGAFSRGADSAAPSAVEGSACCKGVPARSCGKNASRKHAITWPTPRSVTSRRSEARYCPKLPGWLMISNEGK